jgi:hypothetical protein
MQRQKWQCEKRKFQPGTNGYVYTYLRVEAMICQRVIAIVAK